MPAMRLAAIARPAPPRRTRGNQGWGGGKGRRGSRMSSRTVTALLSGEPKVIRWPQRGQWSRLGGISGIGNSAPQPQRAVRRAMGLLYRLLLFLFGGLPQRRPGLLLEGGVPRDRGQKAEIALVESPGRREDPVLLGRPRSHGVHLGVVDRPARRPRRHEVDRVLAVNESHGVADLVRTDPGERLVDAALHRS